MQISVNIWDTWNGMGRKLIRIGIASYFLAMGLGYVPGPGLIGLTGLILPDPAAGIFAGLLVIGLSIMILTGHGLRLATLLLSILLFWSSYLTMLDLGMANQLGQFWRDLALIGALMLTYGEPDHGDTEVVHLFRRQRPVRRVIGALVAEPQVTAPIKRPEPEMAQPVEHVIWKTSRIAQMRRGSTEDEVVNIFAVAS